MKSSESKTERRQFRRRTCHLKPIAILGPEPVRVGHIITISDDAVEIQFPESNGRKASSFNELSVLIPEYNNPYFSGRIQVETVSCNTVWNKGRGSKSKVRKCVVSLNTLNSSQRRQLKGACL